MGKYQAMLAKIGLPTLYPHGLIRLVFRSVVHRIPADEALSAQSRAMHQRVVS